MTKRKTAILLLAAGKGERMKSAKPKVLHEICGRPMVRMLIDETEKLAPEKIAAVIGPDAEDVADAVAPHQTVVQEKREGTGHAARLGMEALADFDGTVLILVGDAPLVSAPTMEALIARMDEDDSPAIAVLGFTAGDPGMYGRLIVNKKGELDAIVEARDATPAQLQVDLCNSGMMAADARKLRAFLPKLSNDNAKNEYYLTDVIGLAREACEKSVVVEGAEEELHGINTQVQLAEAERMYQERLRERHMLNGAKLIDPDTVYFHHDTEVGRDVLIEPNVYFGPAVRIGDGVHIKAFCHIEGAVIERDAVVGPFARLRPGTELARNVSIGNFVEVKKATVERGAKINHLSYVGDARVGSNANIGAGTITCNYDGFAKYQTDIGHSAFIGSNTALVAPVTIGDFAIIGAGSVISDNVPPDALALSRPKMNVKSGWARDFRHAKSAAGKGAGLKGAGPDDKTSGRKA